MKQKKFRVGQSRYFVIVTQRSDPNYNEWHSPSIETPLIRDMQPPQTIALQAALGKAIKEYREMYKFTGRPSK